MQDAKPNARRYHEDIQPLLTEIRRMIKRSESSQRQVELEAGFSKGYLSQLLASNLDLKVRHLLAILDVLDEEPATFFARIAALNAAGESRPMRETLDEFVAASGPLAADVEGDLERLYQAGAASLVALRSHMGRVEKALRQLEEQGLIETGPRYGSHEEAVAGGER